jgi:hypothetical protein
LRDESLKDLLYNFIEFYTLTAPISSHLLGAFFLPMKIFNCHFEKSLYDIELKLQKGSELKKTLKSLLINENPKCSGVYGVFDNKGICVYVGATIKTFKERIEEHLLDYRNYYDINRRSSIHIAFHRFLAEKSNFYVRQLHNDPNKEKQFCQLYNICLSQNFYHQRKK